MWPRGAVGLLVKRPGTQSRRAKATLTRVHEGLGTGGVVYTSACAAGLHVYVSVCGVCVHCVCVCMCASRCVFGGYVVCARTACRCVWHARASVCIDQGCVACVSVGVHACLPGSASTAPA